MFDLLFWKQFLSQNFWLNSSTDIQQFKPNFIIFVKNGRYISQKSKYSILSLDFFLRCNLLRIDKPTELSKLDENLCRWIRFGNWRIRLDNNIKMIGNGGFWLFVQSYGKLELTLGLFFFKIFLFKHWKLSDKAVVIQEFYFSCKIGLLFLKGNLCYIRHPSILWVGIFIYILLERPFCSSTNNFLWFCSFSHN